MHIMTMCSYPFRSIQRWRFLFSVGILICTVSWTPGGTSVWGAPPETQVEQESTAALIREAARATEKAWEEFHGAAIGGTLASPALQSKIEQQLHEVRSLLMEARKAERANEVDSVKTLTQKILQITDNIIQASRERKS